MFRYLKVERSLVPRIKLNKNHSLRILKLVELFSTATNLTQKILLHEAQTRKVFRTFSKSLENI